jgi:hypothetical protein
MTNRVCFLLTGQSNTGGNNPGGPGQTLASVIFWYSYFGRSDASAFDDLNDDWGCNFELGKAVNAAGFSCAIINVARGATSSLNWTSGGIAYTFAVPELEEALAALAVEWAGDNVQFIHIRNQGEAEAQTALLATVEAWSANTLAWQTTLEGLVAAAFPDQVSQSIPIIVVGTNSAITGKTHPGVLEAEQLSVAGSAARLVDMTGMSFEGDGVHLTTAGYIQLGQALGAAALLILYDGGLSTDFKNELIDDVRNVTPHTPLATVYYAGRLAGVEVAVGGYARKGVTNNTTNYPAAVDGVKSLAVEQQFTPATGADWGWIDELVEYDASSGGTIRASMRLINPIYIADGDTLVIPADGFQVALPAGWGWAETLRHAILDLAWGGTAHASLATTYPSYYDGDPQDGGTPLGSRVTVTQASTWGASSGGEADSIAAVSITQQVATHWAEHSASSGGNLLFSGELSEAPNTNSLDVGALHTRLEDAA